ncbi:hypothetical protein GCM10028833_10400 [Glycomyces tarimensis]
MLGHRHLEAERAFGGGERESEETAAVGLARGQFGGRCRHGRLGRQVQEQSVRCDAVDGMDGGGEQTLERGQAERLLVGGQPARIGRHPRSG